MKEKFDHIIITRPGEVTDDNKRVLKEELRSGCMSMRCRTMYHPPGQRVGMFPKVNFGLCGDCGHFSFVATQYRIKFAVCDQYDEAGFMIRLSEDDPVSECSSYYTKGEQDANDYAKNAWLLDPEVRKKVGMI
jgi:hypothetical protein